MNTLPNKEDILEFREFLDANDYDERALVEAIGTAVPPSPTSMQRTQYLSREVTPNNALIRLFLLGATIDAETASDVFPAPFIELCERNGLIVNTDGRLSATIVIVAIAEMLIASDAFALLGTDEADTFVLPASTQAAENLRDLTIRDDVETMLDLGCGSGIHALLAARHCESVIATDISAKATLYTEFNASLNGFDNIECRQGNLFEPVANMTFDLIVSNPPFVLSPSQNFQYRDNPLELDELCRQILTEAPQYLTEGGILQTLCETVEVEGQAWADRLREWLTDCGCDAWVLHSQPLHPVHYVAQRQSDVSGSGANTATPYDEWVAYFESNDVAAIHRTMIALRKRDADNWFHIHHVPGEITHDAATSVKNGFAACDFLAASSNDDALLNSVLSIADDVALNQSFSRQDGQWQPTKSLMRLTSGLSMDAEVDVPVMAFLNQLDGSKTLRAALDAFSNAVNADTDKLTADLLPIVRTFIGRGFLLPAS